MNHRYSAVCAQNIVSFSLQLMALYGDGLRTWFESHDTPREACLYNPSGKVSHQDMPGAVFGRLSKISLFPRFQIQPKIT